MPQTPRFASNGVDRVENASLPLVWDDALSPVFALGTGQSAPVITDFSSGVSTGVTVRFYKFVGATVDRMHFAVQVPHDIYLPSTGNNLTMYPHVHWTFLSAPTTGHTVIWEIGYVYAKGSTALASAGTFSTTASTLKTATYTASSLTQMGKHLISPLGSGVAIPSSEAAPSMFIVGTVTMTSLATSTGAALLGVDWHYQKQPLGTVNEYSGY